jgi:predicted RNA-binding Zn-ribbon protein involved in translation (DUF1610 family)
MVDFRARKPGDDSDETQVWRCNACGTEKDKYKPGASEGNHAMLYCSECGEREVHRLTNVDDSTGPLA